MSSKSILIILSYTVSKFVHFLNPVYILVSFRNNVDTVVHYDNNPFWISADTNKDDLE